MMLVTSGGRGGDGDTYDSVMINGMMAGDNVCVVSNMSGSIA